jgi:hypothetical protein
MPKPMSATIPSPPPTVDFSGKWYNQRGSEMDDLISFTVNFGHFSTLTSWAGQYAKEKNEPEMLHTCFVAAVDIKEALESRDIWGGVKVGSDFFQRTEWTWPGSRLKARGNP